ncbi:MAG: hypothetical protein GY926_19430 [bacterium]|nr:hypothetical protein [bacterium]
MMNDEIKTSMQWIGAAGVYECRVISPDGRIARSALKHTRGEALMWISENLARELEDWDLSGGECVADQHAAR